MKNLKISLTSIFICLFLTFNVNAKESSGNYKTYYCFYSNCAETYDQPIADYFADLGYRVAATTYNAECTEARVETDNGNLFLATLSGGGIIGHEEIQ